METLVTRHERENYKSVTQIENRKLNWNTESRIRSLDNHSHKPGGGDKKIENRKLDWNVESRIGSTKNLKHKAGGGNIQVSSKNITRRLNVTVCLFRFTTRSWSLR